MSSGTHLFKEINNAVLDLQASQLQSYERPLRKLAKLLDDPALAEVNAELTRGIDVDMLLQAGRNSGGSFAGSQTLNWPDDQREYLGSVRELLRRFGEDPSSALTFGRVYFYSGSNKIIAGLHAMIRQLVIPFVRDYEAYVASFGRPRNTILTTPSKRVFIIHGHDDGPREAVARFLERLSLEPLILHEQANSGRTIIEKIEAHSDVGFAVVLLTPDDEGRVNGATDLEPRARQNVLLELGFFMAHLGRSHVCVLMKGQVEIPSDFAGVVWGAIDGSSGWKQLLGRELVAAGYMIDWNKVMA